MCGRYTLYDIDILPHRYNVDVPDQLHPNYNVAPTQTMPVITEKGLQLMRWGLIPNWAKDEKIGYKLFNARSESVFDKPIWKKPVMERRCLVPANGFYEWQKRADGKQPFFIRLKGGAIFSFAGVYELWHHDNKIWRTYSILTTEPNAEMKPIHNRMPVILHQEDEDQWLHADSKEDLAVLLRPYDDDALNMYEVSREVNTTRANDKSLIGPVNSR